MATDEPWARHLRTAKRAAEERADAKLTYRWMGEALGRALGRKPFRHSTVRSWFEEGQEPESFALVRAIAQLLGTTVGELLDATNGESSDGPSPIVYGDEVVTTPGPMPIELHEREADLRDQRKPRPKKRGA